MLHLVFILLPCRRSRRGGPLLWDFCDPSGVNASTAARCRYQAPVVDLPVQTGCSDRSRRLLYLYGWIFAGLSGRVVDTKADVAARTDAPTARTAIGGFIKLRNKRCATHERLEHSSNDFDNIESHKTHCATAAAKSPPSRAGGTGLPAFPHAVAVPHTSNSSARRVTRP